MTDTASSTAVGDVVDRFNAAWNDHDLDAALSLVSDDVVFESTSPAPDGETFTGPDAVRRAWEPIFADTNAHFTVEELVVAGDRVVQRWRYDWNGGHVRGIDLITVHDGKVTSKLAYVKG